MRWKSLSILIVALPGLAVAQPPEQPAVPVVKLTLKPVAAPTPPILYELLPNARDRIRTNAALHYHRAMLFAREFSSSVRGPGEFHTKIEEMLSRPINDDLLKAMSDHVSRYHSALHELGFAVRADRCDWGLEPCIEADGIGTLLPEIQNMRELATLLSIRCRLHIGRGHAAEALRDVRAGFAMARHVAEGPTLIQALVGFAIFQIFAERLEQTLELSGCPNMYWSLAALPQPFVSLRKSIEGEARIVEAALPMIRDIEKPMSPAQAETCSMPGPVFLKSNLAAHRDRGSSSPSWSPCIIPAPKRPCASWGRRRRN
jgi:hypothetical protein